MLSSTVELITMKTWKVGNGVHFNYRRTLPSSGEIFTKIGSETSMFLAATRAAFILWLHLVRLIACLLEKII